MPSLIECHISKFLYDRGKSEEYEYIYACFVTKRPFSALKLLQKYKVKGKSPEHLVKIYIVA